MSDHSTEVATDRVIGNDYAMHDATWRGFTAFTKYSIMAIGVIVLSLYAFIEAGNGVLGTVLLLIIPVAAAWMFVTSSRRA